MDRWQAKAVTSSAAQAKPYFPIRHVPTSQEASTPGGSASLSPSIRSAVGIVAESQPFLISSDIAAL